MMSGRDWRRCARRLEATRQLARRGLPLLVFGFADRGAEDEHALRRNEAARVSSKFRARRSIARWGRCRP